MAYSSKMPATRDGDLVIVVSDDRPVRRWLARLLGRQGYSVTDVDGTSTLTSLEPLQPAAVLLDVDDAPDADSHARVKRLRETSATPVIVLSSRSSEGDTVNALDAGADDYVIKPFAAGELLARVRAVLRRRRDGFHVDPVLRVGPIELDLARHRVVVSGKEVHLTPLEFRILAVFARHADTVVTRDSLIREIWGISAPRDHHLRVHISALRQKIERPSGRTCLVTVAGSGYRLDSQPASHGG